jgi:signal transduction histidine kinase
MKRPAVTAVASSAEELQVVITHVLQRQDEERRLFGRRLHDDLGQLLTILKLRLSALARQTPSPLMQECLDLTQRAVNDTRQLALEAGPSLLDDLGLVPALRWLVQWRTAGTGVVGTVVSEPASLSLPAEWSRVCYRVAEDAVASGLGRPQAKTLVVEVRQLDRAVEMVIRDDGLTGAVADHAADCGLLTMRARVRLAGGELVVHSPPGVGTEVRVRFACP